MYKNADLSNENTQDQSFGSILSLEKKLRAALKIAMLHPLHPPRRAHWPSATLTQRPACPWPSISAQ